jgi:hypothetical protein
MSKAKNLLTAKRKVLSVAKLWLKRQKVRRETATTDKLGQFHTSIDFKKIPDEEKLNAFKGLLKGTVHTRFTCRTISFLNVYLNHQRIRQKSIVLQNAPRPQTTPSSMSIKCLPRPPIHTRSLRRQSFVPYLPCCIYNHSAQFLTSRTRQSRSQKP